MKTILIILLIILGLCVLYFGVFVILEIKKRRDLDRFFVDKAIDYIFGSGEDAPAPKPRVEKKEEEPAVDIIEGGEDELFFIPDLPTVNWDEGDLSLDERFDEVARFVVSEQTAVRKVLQKRLALGYHRAGHILEQLEEKGVVGPENKLGGRAVLIQDPEELERLLLLLSPIPRTHPEYLDKEELKKSFWESMMAEED